MATTTAPEAIASAQPRTKNSFFIPFCVGAMILAAALSVLYASAQDEPASAVTESGQTAEG